MNGLSPWSLSYKYVVIYKLYPHRRLKIKTRNNYLKNLYTNMLQKVSIKFQYFRIIDFNLVLFWCDEIRSNWSGYQNWQMFAIHTHYVCVWLSTLCSGHTDTHTWLSCICTSLSTRLLNCQLAGGGENFEAPDSRPLKMEGARSQDVVKSQSSRWNSPDKISTRCTTISIYICVCVCVCNLVRLWGN